MTNREQTRRDAEKLRGNIEAGLRLLTKPRSGLSARTAEVCMEDLDALAAMLEQAEHRLAFMTETLTATVNLAHERLEQAQSDAELWMAEAHELRLRLENKCGAGRGSDTTGAAARNSRPTKNLGTPEGAPSHRMTTDVNRLDVDLTK